MNAPAGHVGMGHADRPAAAPGLVAIVDDDPSVRDALPPLLRAIGLTGRAFGSAEELLAFDGLEETSCLLLDIAMPGMTGLALQRELARRGHRMPIIVITAQHHDGVRARALAQGASEVLLKPFSEMALVAALNKALGAS